jgi:hypothetical protein
LAFIVTKDGRTLFSKGMSNSQPNSTERPVAIVIRPTTSDVVRVGGGIPVQMLANRGIDNLVFHGNLTMIPSGRESPARIACGRSESLPATEDRNHTLSLWYSLYRRYNILWRYNILFVIIKQGISSPPLLINIKQSESMVGVALPTS